MIKLFFAAQKTIFFAHYIILSGFETENSDRFLLLMQTKAFKRIIMQIYNKKQSVPHSSLEERLIEFLIITNITLPLRPDVIFSNDKIAPRANGCNKKKRAPAWRRVLFIANALAARRTPSAAAGSKKPPCQPQ